MKHQRSFIFALLLLAAVAPNASAQTVFPGQLNVLFADSGKVYAGSGLGPNGAKGSGVYVSSDQGTSWVVDSNGIGSANVQAFAALNGDLFASAQTSFDSSAPGGVFRSTDKGASWLRLLPDDADALATDGDTLFAAGYHQLYRSMDNGANWDTLSNSIGDKSNLFEFHGSLFIRTSLGSVFRSTNGGMDWVHSNITTYGYPAFAAIGNYIFALNSSGVRVSSDNGVYWTSHVEMPADTGAFSSLIAADNLLVAARAEGGIVFSSDDGATWSYPAQYPFDVVASMTFDGTDLIFSVIDTDAVEIFREPLSDLGVEANSPEAQSLRVFPNPASSFLRIQGAGSRADLFDFIGRVVLSSNLSGNGTFDVSRLEPGRYEAVVHTASGIVTAPVIIQH